MNNIYIYDIRAMKTTRTNYIYIMLYRCAGITSVGFGY